MTVPVIAMALPAATAVVELSANAPKAKEDPPVGAAKRRAIPTISMVVPSAARSSQPQSQ